MNARDPARGTPEDRLRALEPAPDLPPEPPASGPDLPEPDLPEPDAQVRAAVRSAPAPTIPAAVLARLDRALGEEAARRRHPPPGRRGLRRAALVAAVGAVLVVLGVGLTALGTAPSGPAPVPAAAPPPAPRADLPTASDPGRVLTVRAADLPTALRAGLGRDDYGFLADPTRRASCLAAHGLAPRAPVGARVVVLDGRPGVLLVLTTGTAARFRLLVVGEACTAATPATLADTAAGPGG